MTARLSAEPAFFSGPDPFFARRLLSMAEMEASGIARDSTPPAQFSVSATLAPWEGRTLEVEARVPADSQPGQTFALRVVQAPAHDHRRLHHLRRGASPLRRKGTGSNGETWAVTSAPHLCRRTTSREGGATSKKSGFLGDSVSILAASSFH